MHGIFFEPPIESNYIGHIMAEVFKDNIYAPYLVRKRDLTILDIGANIGLTSYYFSKYGKVYSMEPSKQHFDIFTEMIKFNKLEDKIVPINKALYIEKGKLPFGGPEDNKTMRSLHTATWPNGKSTEEVECITIEDLFNDYKIKHVDFMKLDIEGSETEVLSHTSFKNVADKIDKVIIEYHEWSGRNPQQLMDALKSNGFKVRNIPSDAHIFLGEK